MDDDKNKLHTCPRILPTIICVLLSNAVVSYLKEYGHRSAGRKGAHLPLAGVAHSHFLVRHARPLHVQGHARADSARY